MEDLLGTKNAIEYILKRYNYNLDKICDGIGAFSMEYKYLGGKFEGFCDYDSKGIKIRIRNWNILRDEDGCWLGWGEDDSASNEGEYYTISYRKAELKKYIDFKNQLTLF